MRVAAVQATPVFMDRDATIDKTCELIAEVGGNQARLAVFPESFVPAYPDWVWTVPAGEDAELGRLYAELLEQAVTIPSAATDRVCQAARDAKVNVVLGVTERNAEASNASLYDTLLYVSDTGELLGKHRKLVPTGGERLVWAYGDGSTLGVYDTRIGRLGGLICWENYMPLARYALYAWGIQIHVAATWDRGEPWLSTLRHIGKEGRTFVIGCCMPLRLADIPDRYAFKTRYTPQTDWINGGDSTIVGPDGQVLAGPLHEEAGILYADLDLNQTRGPKWMLDVAGHYARPDVFDLTIRTTAHPMLRIDDGPPVEEGAPPR